MIYKKPINVLEFDLICKKCGNQKTLPWHNFTSARQSDYSEFIYKTISHNLTRFKCANCNTVFQYSRATIYEIQYENEKQIIFSEEITSNYFERFSIVNKSFLENRDHLKPATVSIDSTEDFYPDPIRKRICPKCGHRYTGNELCPKKENHNLSKPKYRERDIDDDRVATKEFLNKSHRENTNIKNDD